MKESLHYKGYFADIAFNDTEKVYIAQLNNIENVSEVSGKTMKELVSNFKDIVNQEIKSSANIGKLIMI